MAVNNLTKIQNLQRCESLQKLDMTVNFLDKAGLLSVQSLQQNEHLSELYLLGNPCADWSGYRQFVVGTLPQLRKLVSAAQPLYSAPFLSFIDPDSICVDTRVVLGAHLRIDAVMH